MKLTPQQALEEARKRYPEGTVYLTTANKTKHTVTKNHLFEIGYYLDYFLIFSEPAKGSLYDSRTDQWAEIISTPKSLEERLVDGFGFKVEVLDLIK